MSSEQSSFRQMYEFPQAGREPKYHRAVGKPNRIKWGKEQLNDPPRPTFYEVVQKAKNVAKFTEILKQRIAQKQTLNMHTLKPSELDFLQNDSRRQQKQTFLASNSLLALIVEIIFIVTLLVYLWGCTFEIIFGKTHYNFAIIIVSIVVYAVHILFFNITEYENDKLEIVTDRSLIAEIYIKKKLGKDLIVLTTMAIQLTALEEVGLWLVILSRLISLICYLQLRETGEKIENLLCFSNQAESLMTILKMVFKVVLFLHCLSMFLNLMAILEQNNGNDNTWIRAIGQANSCSLDKYVVGWYWSATILSTVGFGEITPASTLVIHSDNLERFIISIIQIICCMSFGYFVNFVGSFIKVQAESEQKYEKQRRSLNRCMNVFTITHELKHKIRTHYFNKYIIEKMHNAHEQKEITENLTPSLKTALMEESNIHILMKCTPITHFTNETLRILTHIIKRVVFAPEHILYSRNTNERNLWLIENGIIEQFTNNFPHSKLQKLIAVYNERERVVGWINFLTQAPYRSLAKVKVFTVGHELDEDSFMGVLKYNERDYRKFLQLKQKLIEKDRKYLHKCISCDRYTHNVINCPRIHFVTKDIKTLSLQSQHLDHFLNEQKRSNKIQRPEIRYKWKKNFGTGELQKQAKALTISEHRNSFSGRTQNAALDTLLKNFNSRDSVIGLDKRRMSNLRISKNQSLNDYTIEPKEISNSSESIGYFEMQLHDEVFEKVFFNKQNKDYMPENDVEEVLSMYSKKYIKKMILNNKDYHFTYKEIN